MTQPSEYEEHVWRSYLLGAQDRTNESMRGLTGVLEAVSSDAAFDRATESREQMLERLLEQERTALRALR